MLGNKPVCCLRAQFEIRGLAWLMLAKAKAVAPLLFENAGPVCLQGMECPSGIQWRWNLTLGQWQLNPTIIRSLSPAVCRDTFEHPIRRKYVIKSRNFHTGKHSSPHRSLQPYC
jgi:thymidylate synthase ThyX